VHEQPLANPGPYTAAQAKSAFLPRLMRAASTSPGASARASTVRCSTRTRPSPSPWCAGPRSAGLLENEGGVLPAEPRRSGRLLVLVLVLGTLARDIPIGGYSDASHHVVSSLERLQALGRAEGFSVADSKGRSRHREARLASRRARLHRASGPASRSQSGANGPKHFVPTKNSPVPDEPARGHEVGSAKTRQNDPRNVS